MTQSTDAGAYYHELFLRGRPQLCLRMVRQKVKGTGHKQPADAQTEPNFYALPPVTPEGFGGVSGGAKSTAITSPSAGSMASPSIPPTIATASPRLDSAAPLRSATVARTRESQGQIYEESPRTQAKGLHEAAFLLKGMSASLGPPTMPMPTALGASPAVPPAPANKGGGSRGASGFSLQYRHDNDYQQQSPRQQQQRSYPRETPASFSTSPPQGSSYSSLLWGGDVVDGSSASGPSAISAPFSVPKAAPAPASFLWPQAAPAKTTPSGGRDKKTKEEKEESN